MCSFSYGYVGGLEKEKRVALDQAVEVLVGVASLEGVGCLVDDEDVLYGADALELDGEDLLVL